MTVYRFGGLPLEARLLKTVAGGGGKGGGEVLPNGGFTEKVFSP